MKSSVLLTQVASSEILEKAFLWCCKARENFPDNSDIWLLRERWDSIKPLIRKHLLDGSYRFSPMLRYRTNCDDGSRAVWDAEDARVIKAISLVLTEYLKPKLSKQCIHPSSTGGIQASITSS
ncbi:MAG: hypothetical protein PHC75_05560 [Burkholderiales bacterium]|nr:hypothetical protein [Burkholderiales bacterium]